MGVTSVAAAVVVAAAGYEGAVHVVATEVVDRCDYVLSLRRGGGSGYVGECGLLSGRKNSPLLLWPAFQLWVGGTDC